MVWFETFNDIFWISVSTGVFAFLTVVIKTALKSKCDETNLCYGLIKIHRRVELERDKEIPTPQATITNHT